MYIDYSKVNLKAILLHEGGKKIPSVPLAHAANMKEFYENMKLFLEEIQHEKYNWNPCGDLKVIGVLLGLQLGCTLFCCSLCEWDSRDIKYHYIQTYWPRRESLILGDKM